MPTVRAAVDVGSTSVHLLVAEVDGREVRPIVDESAFLALGEASHGGAPLGRAKRVELAGVLADYADVARRCGARSIAFLGTEPTRRAGDAARVVHDVALATGVDLLVLSHEEEAYLTVVGVLAGVPVTHATLVVDPGGGSSEFALVGPRETAAFGLRLGSARLTAEVGADDPPTAAQVEAMAASARAILAGVDGARPGEVVAVGGTASNLLKLLPDRPLAAALTRGDLRRILAVAGSAPSAQTAERYLVRPARARLLPAGAVIIDAILERFGVEWVRISGASLREGAVLAVHHAGPGWRDRLPALARGWRGS